jgi:hypothetical protein
MWRVSDPSSPDLIQQYRIGNGSILPWFGNVSDRTSSDYATSAQLKVSEVFCHWISSKDWDADYVAKHQIRSVKYLTENDRLLIGAPSGFSVNQNCKPSSEDLLRVKTFFFEQHAIHPPGVSPARRFKDSQSFTLQASILSVMSVGSSLSYKRQSGHTIKDVLVERWRDPKLRDHADLEVLGGLQVSLCTRNALRTRLRDVLRSRTAKKYLESILFEWVSEECEAAYFTALQSRKLFKRFWGGPVDWRKNAGDAISVCLDMLQDTGVDQDNRHLSTLWVEAFEDIDSDDDYEQDSAGSCADSPEAEKMIINLFRSEYTWTSLVKDSEECLTMAVMVTSCLVYRDKHGYGRRCCGFKPIKTNGYPVLKTRLYLNQSILQDEGLLEVTCPDTSKVSWNTDRLRKGTSFNLGNHGTLVMLQKVGKGSALEVGWKPILSETVQEIKNVAKNEMVLGKGVERHHWEYLPGVCASSPLTVLVLSDRSEPLFESKK